MTMHEAAQRFPLSWPSGWKRTHPAARERATFGKTVTRDGALRQDNTRERIRSKGQLNAADATARLSGELDRLGATNPILSTNVEVRLDGVPKSNRVDPVDPGAAVYFTLKGKPRCLACDKWDRVADNIAALAQHIDALRRIERYGVGTMEQAFAGYAALPPDPGHDWRIVFGFGAQELVSPTVIDARFKQLARTAHPDAGGTVDAMTRLNVARDAAMRELGEIA